MDVCVYEAWYDVLVGCFIEEGDLPDGGVLDGELGGVCFALMYIYQLSFYRKFVHACKAFDWFAYKLLERMPFAWGCFVRFDAGVPL